MSPNVWIVPVNYNGTEDTRKCLRSLAALSTPAHVVVVDNASHPDPTASLRAEFPWAHVVRNEANLGWSGGNNTGIRFALDRGADDIVLLNNDTTVAPTIVERLLAAFAAHPRFGVIGPVIRYMDEPGVVMTDGVTFNPPGFPGFFQRREVPERATDPPAVDDTDIVNGCCMMVRADVFRRVGLIDDRFFLIHEEADFCLRVARAGFACGVLAEPLVWHKGSTSSSAPGKSGSGTTTRGTWRCSCGGTGAVAGAACSPRMWPTSGTRTTGTVTSARAAQPDAADAVLEGLIDAAQRRTGPYRDRPRWTVPVLRGAFEMARRLKGIGGPAHRPHTELSAPVGLGEPLNGECRGLWVKVQEGNADADVPELVARREPETRRRTAAVGDAVPRTAAENAIICFIVQVVTQLPSIAMHVAQSPQVRGDLLGTRHGRCPLSPTAG